MDVEVATAAAAKPGSPFLAQHNPLARLRASFDLNRLVTIKGGQRDCRTKCGSSHWNCQGAVQVVTFTREELMLLLNVLNV